MAKIQSAHVWGWVLGIGSLLVGIATDGPALPNAPAEPTERKIDFNRDVRPILSEHCFRCHGPDEAARQTGLRLDSFEGATADRGGYQVIVPGAADESLVWMRVSAESDEMRMPPHWSGVAPLNKAQQETIRLWIDAGAEYRPHWAFVSPIEPTPPTVANTSWPRGDIDMFVLARLEEAGLAPEPEADLATLARRASLTLTGLPPTPNELDEILADKSPDAYERYVDRLLDSPRYGENQARYWLDAVRYGDTHGLHLDNKRNIWPYRDWVVRAFNEDLAYDDFTTWQLAGDLLPDPTTEQRIATGYVRMNPTTNEGGAITAEVLANNTFDRVDTASTVFLGLTLACARCHDHKYDPFTTEEYYSLFAYFNSTTDNPLDGNSEVHPPVMRAPTPSQDIKIRGWRGQLRSIEDETDLEAAHSWVASARIAPPVAGSWEVAGPFTADDFAKAFSTDFGPELEGDTSEWRPIGIELGKGKAKIIGKDNAAAYLRTTISAPQEQDLELRLGSDDGIRVWLNGELVHDNKVARALTANADTVTVKLKKGANALLAKIVNGGGADGFYISFGDPRAERIDKVFKQAQKPAMNAAETRELTSAFLEYGPDSGLAERYRAVLADVRELEGSLPMTLVAQEMPKPRETFVLRRGSYDSPTDTVERGVPATLGSLPTGAPNNRLGLAQWMTAGDNPLLARVFVNRVWQQHFGTGLVKTAENFGNQGDWPSHPGLLDHLATRFVEHGWSVKELHRSILTSATFMQRATAGTAKRFVDPDNRLLSRGPRFRLDAEVVRDQALYAAGLLVEKMGGPGVNPYQPAGLWEAVGYTRSNTANYVQDHGEALYRRSIYIFWKRTSPPAALAAFDAPTRETCTVMRSRTNTPLQALATMNDIQFAEASRAMAQRVMLAEATDEARADLAFRLATGRRPKAGERAVVLRVLRAQRAAFDNDTEGATKLISVGESERDETLTPAEHAAWTMVCNMVLNLDEALTQH